MQQQQQHDEHVTAYVRAQLMAEALFMLDHCDIANTLLKVCAIAEARMKYLPASLDG